MTDFASRISSGRRPGAMRNVIYGPEGLGKTTFCTQFPEPITLAAENGTDHLDTSRFVPANFNEAMEFLAYLYSDPDHGYRTVNVDTIGWLESMAATALCDEYQSDSLEKLDGGYGKWKRFLVERMDLVLQWGSALHDKGMHVNLIGHVEVKKYSDPAGEDYDRFIVATLADKVGERAKQWADNVLFMNFDTMIAKEEKGFGSSKAKSFNRRLVHARRAAAFDAKTRMGLPDKFDFGEPPEEGFQLFWSYYEQWSNQVPTAPAAPAITSIQQEETA